MREIKTEACHPEARLHSRTQRVTERDASVSQPAAAARQHVQAAELTSPKARDQKWLSSMQRGRLGQKATKSRTSFVRRAELRCAARIGAPGPFTVAAAVLLTETHCIHKHGIRDLSCKQHAQQNRFGCQAVPVGPPTAVFPPEPCGHLPDVHKLELAHGNDSATL